MKNPGNNSIVKTRPSTIEKLIMLDNLAKHFYYDHTWLQTSKLTTNQEVKLRNTFLAIAKINGFSNGMIARYLNKDLATIRYHLASMKPHWKNLTSDQRSLFVVPSSQLKDL